jgi:hypothetical protein
LYLKQKTLIHSYMQLHCWWQLHSLLKNLPFVISFISNCLEATFMYFWNTQFFGRKYIRKNLSRFYGLTHLNFRILVHLGMLEIWIPFLFYLYNYQYVKVAENI